MEKKVGVWVGIKSWSMGRCGCHPPEMNMQEEKTYPRFKKTVAGVCVGSPYRYISLLSTLIYLSLPLSPVNPTPRLLPGFSVRGIQITFL